MSLGAVHCGELFLVDVNDFLLPLLVQVCSHLVDAVLLNFDEILNRHGLIFVRREEEEVHFVVFLVPGPHD